MPPDDAHSRTAILDAAEKLFATQGYAATTIKQIGTEAGVNSALLYYYFADKLTLYQEIIRRLLETLTRGGTRVFDEAKSPEEAVRGLVSVQGELMTSRPYAPRLIARELVDHEAAHASEHIAKLAAGVFARLCDVIRDGQRSGIFRDDLDPRFAAISTISQVVYFHIARPAVGIVLGYGAAGPPADVARTFSAHAADYAIAALTAPNPARAGTRKQK
jgi:AcrR family transcriptional regulator